MRVASRQRPCRIPFFELVHAIPEVVRGAERPLDDLPAREAAIIRELPWLASACWRGDLRYQQKSRLAIRYGASFRPDKSIILAADDRIYPPRTSFPST